MFNLAHRIFNNYGDTKYPEQKAMLQFWQSFGAFKFRTDVAHIICSCVSNFQPPKLNICHTLYDQTFFLYT